MNRKKKHGFYFSAISIFFAAGFGLYGQLERHQLYMIVAGIWISNHLQYNMAKIFRFGPFEWAWRSLTYWKRQPIKK